jgi:predicted RNase H-like nuclease (RuvC/YqgF family)
VEIKAIIAQVRAKIEQVRSKIDGEEAAKLISDLKSIEEGVTDLQTEVERVNGESKGRKIEIRDLKKDIADKDEEIDSLKKKTDTSELTKEVETLREFKSNILKGQRDSFGADLKSISKHPKFESMKGFYKLPEPDKDGNYDLSKIEDADLEFNIAKLQEHKAAEVFGKVEKIQVFGEPRNDEPGEGGGPGKIESESDVSSAIDKAFEQY